VQWNLDQVRLFVSVAETGSFSAAARQLGRAQSAVSSAIALLEADLNVLLFERSSGRQPRLTDSGRALLDEARQILRHCERLESRALGLTRGEETRLRLAHDEAMPYQPIVDSLEALATTYPFLDVQLASGAQGEVARKLLDRRADLGLMFHHEHIPDALERRRLSTVEMVTVCGAGHSLAHHARITRQQLAQHRQILIAPYESGYPGGEPISPQVWRADSFYVTAELVMRDIGWAWLPRHVARYPTYLNHLVELVSDWTPPPLVVELVWRRAEPLGPAAQWLGEHFAEQLQAIG
jgi:DNA-binding transcriptional LysR family regulator